MTAFDVANASDLKKLNDFLETNSYLSGCTLPGQEDAIVLKCIKEAPCMNTYPAAFAWWFSLVLFTDAVKAEWGKSTCNKKDNNNTKKECNEKKPAEEDDDLDLFGDDDGEEAKKVQEELKAQMKKPAKKVPVAKSSVVLDIKGYDDTVDLKKIGDWILSSIVKDGLVWQDKYKLVPHVYGTFKLQVTMIIEDAKISTDDISDIITEKFEDDVQSVDIAEFSKI